MEVSMQDILKLKIENAELRMMVLKLQYQFIEKELAELLAQGQTSESTEKGHEVTHEHA